jgi:hypothetical protein
LRKINICCWVEGFGVTLARNTMAYSCEWCQGIFAFIPMMNSRHCSTFCQYFWIFQDNRFLKIHPQIQPTPSAVTSNNNNYLYGENIDIPKKQKKKKLSNFHFHPLIFNFTNWSISCFKMPRLFVRKIQIKKYCCRKVFPLCQNFFLRKSLPVWQALLFGAKLKNCLFGVELEGVLDGWNEIC